MTNGPLGPGFLIFFNPPVEELPRRSTGLGGGDSKRSGMGEDIHRDDNEILEILAIAARFLN